MITFVWAGAQWSVDVDGAVLKTKPQPIKCEAGEVSDLVIVARWFPTTPPKAMGVERYTGPEAEALVAKMDKKIEKPASIGPPLLKSITTPEAKTFQIVSRPMTLYEIRERVTEGKWLTVYMEVPLHEFLERSMHGFNDYIQFALTAPTVMQALSDWNFRIVGHLDPSSECKVGAAILEVKVNVSECL
jgi:hypothetical protein